MQIPPQQAKRALQKGFTLVEILVAISIFSVVVISTIGAFLKMVDVNKKIQSVRTAMDNANLAMETMARSIRLGTNYYCTATSGGYQGGLEPAPQDCTSGGTLIGFEGQRGEVGNPQDQIYYQLNPTTGQIERTINSQTIPITSADITIQKMEFFVDGSQSVQNGNRVQPRVRIVVVGKTNLPNNSLNFNFSFQTIATQRLLDS